MLAMLMSFLFSRKRSLLFVLLLVVLLLTFFVCACGRCAAAPAASEPGGTGTEGCRRQSSYLGAVRSWCVVYCCCYWCCYCCCCCCCCSLLLLLLLLLFDYWFLLLLLLLFLTASCSCCVSAFLAFLVTVGIYFAVDVCWLLVSLLGTVLFAGCYSRSRYLLSLMLKFLICPVGKNIAVSTRH